MIPVPEQAITAENNRRADPRFILAWILMVLFIVLPPVGLAIVLGSIGWGIMTLGLTSGVVGYILGTD